MVVLKKKEDVVRYLVPERCQMISKLQLNVLNALLLHCWMRPTILFILIDKKEHQQYLV